MMMINESLVNFVNTGNSPLVQKLRVNRHNCGLAADCEDLAAEMLQAIEEWRTKRQ